MRSFLPYFASEVVILLLLMGIWYALFPGSLRKFWTLALSSEDRTLRLAGLVMFLSGLLLAFFLQSVPGG